MRFVLLALALTLAAGCETYRHQYVPECQSAPQTKCRYALKDCNVYEYSSVLKEHHREIMNVRAFKGEDLVSMEKLYPDVFSPEGIPVSVRLCYDMDRYDCGSVLLGLADAFLFLGTVGIVPLVSAEDEFVEVELEVGDGGGRSPRIGVTGSSRSIIWFLGLNLLFPFDEPTDSRFSKSGSSWCGRADETHAVAVNKKCREAAYAYAIAAALARYEAKKAAATERQVQESCPARPPEKSAAGVIELEEIPL